jgi:hypothetical protein
MLDWRGKFGDEYTERNKEIPSRKAFWESVVKRVPSVETYFEVGCNTGANLDCIPRETHGIEINASAAEIARRKGHEVIVEDFLLWLPPNGKYEFVFCSGVLIHQCTPEVIKIMKNMRSLSEKYLLFNEYYNDWDQEVPYRNNRGALYKRDYGRIYNALYPHDLLLTYGELTKEDGFDNTNYWLFVKGAIE